MKSYLTPKYISVTLVLLLLLGVSFYFYLTHRDFKVAPIQLEDNTSIQFPYTDENSGESLIIKTDQHTYSGLSNSDVYISVTNTKDIDEKAVLLFHLPKAPENTKDQSVIPTMKTLAQFQPSDKKWSFINFFKENIKLNDNLLANALKKRESIPKDLAINSGAQIEIPAHQTMYFKSKLQYPPGSKGEFWIETIGANGGYGLLDPWYSSSHTFRKAITIDFTKVASASSLTNFPVLINHTDPDIRTSAFGGKLASGSGEFIFTSSDGTTSLPYEIEKYSSSSGELVAWVNVSTLSNTQDTLLYMYYGGQTAGGATNQNRTGTWNSAYLGVWHMNDNAANNTVKDSTSNNNSGTYQEVNTSGKSIQSKIGRGFSFDGSINRIQDITSSGFKYTGGDMSYTGWLYINSADTDSGYIVSKPWNGNGSYNYYLYWSAPAESKPYFHLEGATGYDLSTSNNTLLTNAWHQVGFTVKGSTKSVNLYVDGIIVNAGTHTISSWTPPAPGDQSLSLAINHIFPYGAPYAGNSIFNIKGNQDENHFSTSVRSDGWIKTEYNNQNFPRTFYTLGAGEQSKSVAAGFQFGTSASADTKPGWFSSAFNYRKKFTIPSDKVSGGSDLTNFPVLINYTDPDLRTTANGGHAASGSGEFIFTSSGGTASISYEIESYTATTGQITAWVNVPTLSATQDTSIYMYYGGAAAGGKTKQTRAATWDTNYKLVAHLPDGTTLTAKDSTSNSNNGTITGAVAIAGKIGGGVRVDTSGNQYIDFGQVSNLGTNGAANLTAEWWYYNEGSVTANRTAAGTFFDVFGVQTLGIPNEFSGWMGYGTTLGYFKNGAGTMPYNVWNHIVLIYDGSQGTDADRFKAYLNGVQQTLTFVRDGGSGAFVPSTLPSSTQHVYLGYNLAASTNNNYWDEFRVSLSTRTGGYATTTYNNQNSPRTFYTIGAEENPVSHTVKYGTSTSADTKPGWYYSQTASKVWKNRIKFTIPSSKVSGGSNLTNFPVLLSFTEKDLATTANGGHAASGSGEFIFTSSGGTASISYEIESYSATTGNLVAWVNVSTLSASQDTSIYMYYNGPSAGSATNQNKDGTWNTNYKIVSHYRDGSTLDVSDSSGYGNNGTNNGSVAAVAGKFGGGAYENGTINRWISYPSIAAFAGAQKVTVSIWMYVNTMDSSCCPGLIIGTNETFDLVGFQFYNPGYPSIIPWVSSRLGGGIYGETLNIGVGRTGEWQLINIVYDGSLAGASDQDRLKVYYNGVQQTYQWDTANHVPDTTNASDATNFTIFGPNTAWPDTKVDEFHAILDASSAGWVATEYANQNSPRSFYIVGRPEANVISGNSGSEIPGTIKSR